MRFRMGANNGRQCESEGKGSSSISSDISSTEHSPTKAPKNVATSEDSDISLRTLSTPSPVFILNSTPSSSQLFPNGHETSLTIAMVHPPPGTRPSKAPNADLVEALPDPALLYVFSFLCTSQLCRCARVCRRWYNLAWDPRLWNGIYLTGELLNVDRALRTLTHRLCQDTPNVCLTLETVVVSGCRRLSDRGLRVIAQCSPELRRLEVAGCFNVSNSAVFDVVSQCPNLQHLDLSGCPQVTCIGVMEEAWLQQTGLRYLDMTACVSLEDRGLKAIALHCQRLTHLYLRRCSLLTDESVRLLALHCTALRQLSLSDCALVGDFGLREVARLEGRLRYLGVAHCMRITDVGLRYVARYCPRLRYLNARGCEGITDQGLSHLARSCSRLRCLDVGRCPLVTDSGLETVARHCQGLRRLSLRGCEGLTRRGLRALARGCPELQLLNVQECEVPEEELRLIRRHCPRCVIEHSKPAFY